MCNNLLTLFDILGRDVSFQHKEGVADWDFVLKIRFALKMKTCLSASSNSNVNTFCK